MDQEERETLATDRAERYAPRPTGGILMAGVCGAGVALIGDAMVSRFYGWRLRDHLLLAVLVAAGGFLVAMLGYSRLLRVHRKAQRAELNQIKLDEEGPGSPDAPR